MDNKTAQFISFYGFVFIMLMQIAECCFVDISGSAHIPYTIIAWIIGVWGGGAVMMERYKQ